MTKNGKKDSPSTEALSIVYLPTKQRKVSHEERMRQIPRRLDPATRQWTITRRDHFAHAECRSSPPARDLPQPPASWFPAFQEDKREKSGQDSGSDTSRRGGSDTRTSQREEDLGHGSDAQYYSDEELEDASSASTTSSTSTASSSELEMASLGQSPCFGK